MEEEKTGWEETDKAVFTILGIGIFFAVVVIIIGLITQG